MNLQAINAIIDEDLTHMPVGRIGSAQRTLRVGYANLRTQYLSIDSTRSRGHILEEAIDIVRRTQPDGLFEYEHNYFES